MAKWTNSDGLTFKVRGVINSDEIVTRMLAEDGITEPTAPKFKNAMGIEQDLTAELLETLTEDATSAKQKKQAAELQKEWAEYTNSLADYTIEKNAQLRAVLAIYGCAYHNEIPEDFVEKEREVYPDFQLPDDKFERGWEFVRRHIATTNTEFDELTRFVFSETGGLTADVESRLRFRRA